MNIRKGNFNVLGVAALIAGLILSIPAGAAAQTKKKPVRKTTRQTSVPQPVQTMPVIISQADQNQNQQIVTGTEQPPTPVQTQPETFDEKLDKINARLKELNSRMKNLESTKQNEYDERQKRLLLNLDILTRAEQRAETLRKQMYDLVEKENTIKTKLQNLEMDLRPEMIDRQISMAGSLRPEELRDLRTKSLDSEKRNLQSLLSEIQETRQTLEQNVIKADQLVDKLRAVLEKDIDAALSPKEDQ